MTETIIQQMPTAAPMITPISHSIKGGGSKNNIYIEKQKL